MKALSRLFLVSGLLLTGASVAPLMAQSGTWTQTAAGTYNWGTTTDWSGGVVASGAGNTANFTTNLAGAVTVNLEQAYTIGTLNLYEGTANDVYTIASSGGYSLTLNNGSSNAVIDQLSSSRENYISVGLVLAGNVLMEDQTSNNLGITSAITGTGNITIDDTYTGANQLLNGTNIVNNSGAITNTSTGAASLNVDIDQVGANVTSIIQDASASTDLMAVFSGNTAVQTFVGSYVVESGTMRFGSTGQSNSSNVLYVNNGAIFTGQSNYSFTLAGIDDYSSSNVGGTVEEGTNQTLTLAGTGTYSFGGNIASGKININGGATQVQTLSGANSDTALFQVYNNSTLNLTGSTAGAISVYGGGTLKGTGAAAGNVNITGGGNINLVDGTIGTLTIGSLTTGGSATTPSSFTFEIGTGGTSGSAGTSGSGSNGTDLIADNGALTATTANGTRITIENINNTSTQTLTNGSYDLVAATSISGPIADYSLQTTSLDGHTLGLSIVGTDLVLTVSGGGPAATNGQYTIATSVTGSVNVHANGGTTTLGTTITNTGSGTQDTLNYSGLTATSTGNTISGTAGSGTALAQNSSGSATETFTAGNTAGTETVTPTATVTNTNDTAQTPVGTTMSTTVNVYSGLSTWALDGSGAWGTTTSSFGTNWGANQGSPGVTAGFTSTDTATFGNFADNPAIEVDLNTAAPSLKSITFNAPYTSYNLAQGSGSHSITLNGGSSAATVTDTAGTQTISAPVILATGASVNVASGQQLNFAGGISGGYALAVATGTGATYLTNPTGSTYTGGTTISAGTVYADNMGGASYSPPVTPTPVTAASGAGSATGTGPVTVQNTGTLAGSGTIAPTSGGVTVQSGGILSSGDVQSNASPYMVSGNGLTLNNAAGLTSILAVNAGAELQFALGAGTNGTSGYMNYANPETDSTYLSIAGDKAGEVNFATSGAVTIDMVDLTTTAPFGTSLTLRQQNPYLLIQAGSDSDYDLETSGGYDQNGYVLGTSANGGTTVDTSAFNLEVTALGSSTPINSSTNYQNLQLYLYNGDLEVVPEPGTWALMLGGVAFLIIIQRRRSRQNV
jgi:fibronectin-binding autotransporter adhesin